MLCLEIGQSNHNAPKPGVLNYAARGLGAAPGERFPSPASENTWPEHPVPESPPTPRRDKALVSPPE